MAVMVIAPHVLDGRAAMDMPGIAAMASDAGAAGTLFFKLITRRSPG